MICTRISKEEFSEWKPGSMLVLGKLFDISKQILRDTPERIAEAKALLYAIRAEANSNVKRMVSEASLRRALGIIVYITQSSVYLRSHLRGMIRGLMGAGAWTRKRKCLPGNPNPNNQQQHAQRCRTHAQSEGVRNRDMISGCLASSYNPSKHFSSNQTDLAWRMAQSSHIGANILEENDDESIQSWLNDWIQLPLGVKCCLPKSCDAEFEALFHTLSTYNGASFMPRRSPPDPKQIIYLMHDSAGLSDEDEHSARACGTWFYSPGWDHIIMSQEQWCPEILQVAHSTAMECANGLSNLEYAMRTWPGMTYIEVYDSLACTDIVRSMSSKSVVMRTLLKKRFQLLSEFPDSRVLVLWQNRELGFIADLITKYNDADAIAALQERFPHLEIIRDYISDKPPNMINNATYAASWTAKADESFN